MSQLTQLNISLIINTGGTVTNPVVVVPIPKALQNLDSEANQNAAAQTGLSAADALIRAIFRAGCFQANGVWYSTFVIQSIVAS